MSLHIDASNDPTSTQPLQITPSTEVLSTMRQFHPFSRLPPELRQLIWSLSIEDQDISIESTLYSSRLHYKPPALLQACSESRSYSLRRHYISAFFDRRPHRPPYRWVNFEVDAIHLYDHVALPTYPMEQVRIKTLIIEDGTHRVFRDFHCPVLKRMPALRNVTVFASLSRDDRLYYHVRNGCWWVPWAPVFESLYHDEEEGPASFRLRVVAPKICVHNTERPGISRWTRIEALTRMT
ncbi:hypothetical protein PG993_009245 [Apiospora rasikravindrae]|uniref:2EXR domain-containing protein n=1 Tax=Apiospora rasikravindrae TaxID=990691 RepID=A0ABR1SKM3_9PEZI